MDIKKVGVFPIVQGIRSLALREKIRETRTVKRINILMEKKILEQELGNEYLSLWCFKYFKIKVPIAENSRFNASE